MNPLDPESIMSLATDINRMRSSDQAEIDRLREGYRQILDTINPNGPRLPIISEIQEICTEALKGGQS